MSQQVTCPNCFAALKPSKLPPLGTKVRCPKCEQSFRLDTAHVRQSDSSPAPAATSIPAMGAPPRAAPAPVAAQPAASPAFAPADAEGGVPAWAWATGGGLVAAIVLLILLTAAGVFDRHVQPAGPTIGERPLAMAQPERGRNPSAVDQAVSPFQSLLNPAAPSNAAGSSTGSSGNAASRSANRSSDSTRPVTESASSSLDSSSSGSGTQAPAPVNSLEFALKPDLNYQYDFEVNSGGDGQGPLKMNGNISYRLEPARAQAAAPSIINQAFKTKKIGGGTAFVVNSQGWLITCAHVVSDATTIHAVLGDRTYRAKAVEVDEPHDLALLKIEAVDLRALPVAGAAPAQGDDVSVAGFPLTTMLGDSLKITHGRIAGFVDRKGEHYIQIDASVNPGNSGGPLLNAEGEVIGVVNAGLFGADISSVGLSIDLAPLRALLQRHQVDCQVGAGGSPLAGNTLAEQVRSAIARVKVEIDPEVPTQQLRVRYSGSVSVASQPTKFAGGVISISPQGEVLSNERQHDYSLLSTTTSALAFEQLPRAGQRQWTASRKSQVIQSDAENNRPGFPFAGPGFAPPSIGRFGPRFGASPFGPQPDQTPSGKRVALDDQLTYDLEELTDDKAVVNTTYISLRSEEPSGKPLGKIAGAGQYTFDRKQGVITSGFAEMKLKAEQEGIEVAVPLRIAYKLREAVTNDELKERGEKARVENAERDAKRKAEEREKLTQAIAKLKAFNEFTADDELQQTLSELNSLGHDLGESSERAEVGPLLNRYFKHPNESVRSSALSAAEQWATKDNIPTLLELVPTQEHFQRRSAILALGASGGDEKSAAALAKLMDTSDFSMRWELRDALKKMKNYAEPVVLPLLESTNKDVRDDACQVLGEVGGRKSFDALGAMLVNSKAGLERMSIQRALDSVKTRLAVQAK